MPDPLNIYSIFAVVNLLMACFALFFFKHNRIQLIWVCLLFGWIIQITSLFIKPGPVSFSGVEATFSLAGIVLLFCQWSSLEHDLAYGLIRPKITAVFMIVMGLGSILPESVGNHSFMTIYPLAVIFFLSRPLSLGITMFIIAGIYDIFIDKSKSLTLSTSKRWAFLSAMIFLGGEIAGCYWGFVGWGTTWRWSGNFYFSAMIFVLYMLALHVPPSISPSIRSKFYCFFIPLLTIAITTIFSKVINI